MKVIRINRFVVTSIFSLFFTLFFCSITVSGADDFRPDYKGDRDKAVEYGNERHDELLQRLTHYELETFNLMATNDFKNVEDLNFYFEDSVRKDSDIDTNYKTFVDDVDGLFKKADQTSNTQYVYLSLNSNMFGLQENYFYSQEDNRLIDSDQFEDLVDDFTFGNFNGFALGNLNSNEYKNDHFLNIRLKVPAKERLLYSGENTVILDRNKSFLINQASWRITWNEKNKQVVCVDADLVDSSRIDQIIDSEKTKINEHIANRLEFPKGTEIVKLHEFKSMKSGIALERVGQIAYHFLDVIPEMIIKKIFLSDVYGEQFSIDFYDKNFLDNTRDIGLYVPTTNTIYYDLAKAMRDDLPEFSFRQIATHELGHAVDYVLLSNDPTQYWSQYDLGMLMLYNAEKDFVTEELSHGLYAKSNAQEYFAEIFADLYSSSEELRLLAMEQVPESSRYILQKVLEAGST